VFAVQLPSAPDPPPPGGPSSHGVQALHPQQVKVDVNRAELKDLVRLPGISRNDAERILAGRPYRSKRDLLRRHLLTERQYERLKDYLIAHRVG
jgi:DNA uptake protein ComE-like DNA-binding protein